MMTKAQKAAEALIKQEIDELISYAERGGDTGDNGWYFSTEFLNEGLDKKIKEIRSVIKENSLDDKLLNNINDAINDAIDKIYESIMRKGRYADALAFAKKYGL